MRHCGASFDPGPIHLSTPLTERKLWLKNPRNEIDDRFRHVFALNAYQIQADVHDVSFYYKKKTGFPKLKDWGVADLSIAGEGIHIHAAFEYDRHAANQTVVPLRVQVNVDDIRVTLHHTKHDTLYKLVAPAIKSAIRKAIITNLEQTVLSWLLFADAQLTTYKTPSRRFRPGTARRAPSFMRSFIPGFLRGYGGGGSGTHGLYGHGERE
ncbi:hypothetical protein H9P43_002009 [Blastocladiella emersonii ATCC 22665]|nr:hypothetical protein H9P43_002009 [Blastocladiella emersonii ATCC 22665]